MADSSESSDAALLAASLRLDYAETVAVWRQLVDVRFKLLALLPTVSAAGIGVFGTREPTYATTLIAVVAILSIVAIAIYDLRNSMFHDTAIHRATVLERRLRLVRASQNLTKERRPRVEQPKPTTGGFFADRPRGRLKLFGIVPVWHDLALWLIYSVSIGGWAAVGGYAFASVRGWSEHTPWSYGAAVGVVAGGIFMFGLQAYDRAWSARIHEGLLADPDASIVVPEEKNPDAGDDASSLH